MEKLEKTLRIFMLESHIRTLGPFLRYGIWLHGCKKNCPGCIYHKTEHDAEYREYVVKDLLETIKNCEGIEGVTISGGEPFLQQEGLYELVKGLRENNYGVIVYTGYKYDELIAESINKDIISNIDILIDGEYIQEEPGGFLVGSTNQKVYFLTDRYKGFKQMYEQSDKRKVSISINDGELHSVGIPTYESEIIVKALIRKKNNG